ncbi:MULTISPECIES: alanine racemase [unclassified Mesorhizobium]|uniref:alanine racemase n=1 Tax=unclassified Mesorhizobium TaxID=325217 RepID=UPI002415218E|nr:MULTISPECIES: alanine racemase [unclassified Mesorhizobium]MDG4889943.1 amino acid deaminase [Mesorhizobium sp. WSM4887]MDG4904086.1 amino acid deaminase [Mesorhizobium sp. WSM4962]MDG4909113.1 amino acid deaminase [Mesorhizobium sp. WSM4898]MDG4921737.1 amino acid deaminase [Mesorhizobium sp. WSM4989]
MAGIDEIATEMGGFELAATFRGVPPGTRWLPASSIAARDWHPADGRMSLPLLSLDLKTYADNKATMLDICRTVSCEIAPHAKTPMSPVLARDLIASGAWGTSVADLRQAEVMLGNGIGRVLIANEIGGAHAAKRLAALLSGYNGAEVYLFVDAPELVDKLGLEWKAAPDLPALNLLIEVGCGRGGVTSDRQVSEIIDAIAAAAEPRLQLAGIAAYEGTANTADEEQLRANLDDLFARVRSALASVRKHVGPATRLVLSMGGSSLFDHVIVDCAPIVQEDGNAFLLLRSGACFFSDHGPIRDRLRAMAARGMLGLDLSEKIAASFKPALRLWAEVLSVCNGGTAICGFGLRDVAHDQGLPVPLALWRDGARIADIAASATLVKLNDQHAFIRAGEGAFQIGDVVEVGVRHPCTTIDKHDLIYGLDETGRVTAAMRTFFG